VDLTLGVPNANAVTSNMTPEQMTLRKIRSSMASQRPPRLAVPRAHAHSSQIISTHRYARTLVLPAATRAAAVILAQITVFPPIMAAAVRSISEFSSAPNRMMMADIHIQIINPIAAPSEP
jgi:hypothetical protein